MDVSVDPPLRACIRRDHDRHALERASLVLTAIDIDNDIEPDGAQWGLWVVHAHAMRANAELDIYALENRPGQAAHPRVTTIDSGWVGVIGYLLIIWMLPSLEASVAFGWNWRAAGAMDAGLVMQGEWWRTITALTLHADLGHLMANSLFGAVFGWFVGRHLGSGFGWLLVLGCGALGNALDASIQSEEFRSIGASTATFASVGIVGAFVWRRGYYRAVDLRRSLAPIFAAIALLAYTGVTGENIDVVAHLMGFAAGICCGIGAAGFDIRRIGIAGQLLCGLGAVAIVATAWSLAGRHG
jgi:membrane associated rhomboid family serine protease